MPGAARSRTTAQGPIVPPRQREDDQDLASHRLAGTVAVVAATDGGTGRSIARDFARHGAEVVISDLSEPQHCRELITQTVRRFGRIDTLVHHADLRRHHARLEEISEDEWEHTFATNVSSLFFLVKAAVPYMGPGSLIISGCSQTDGLRSPEFAPYTASLASIPSLCASLQHYLEPRGVRVSCLVPQPNPTPNASLSDGTASASSAAADAEVLMSNANRSADLTSAYARLACDLRGAEESESRRCG